MPRGINTADIDVGYAQLRRLARNYGIDGDSVLSRTSKGRIVKGTDTDGLLAQLDEGEKLQPQAVVTAIAAKWKGLSEEERGEWNEAAKASAEDSE